MRRQTKEVFSSVSSLNCRVELAPDGCKWSTSNQIELRYLIKIIIKYKKKPVTNNYHFDSGISWSTNKLKWKISGNSWSKIGDPHISQIGKMISYCIQNINKKFIYGKFNIFLSKGFSYSVGNNLKFLNTNLKTNLISIIYCISSILYFFNSSFCWPAYNLTGK